MVMYRCVVSGWVQGVGYRAYTTRVATRHSVGGRVWNRRDGDVEILATADDVEGLEQFIAALRTGPAGARVDDVMVEELDDDTMFVDFNITRGS